MRKTVKNAAFFLTLAGGLIYIYWKRSSLANLQKISGLELGALIIVSLFAFIILGSSFRHVLKVFQVDAPFKEWFGLMVCNSMFNYYLPAKGGTVVRAYYLHERYGFKYSYYVSMSAGSYLITLVLFSGMGILALANRFHLEETYPKILATVLFLFLAGSVLAAILIQLLIRYRKGIGIKKFDAFAVHVKEGLSHFGKNKKQTLAFSLFMCAYLLVLAARLFLCFRFLDVDISLIEALVIRSLAQFSFLISVIPGNLGVNEGVIVFSAGLVDIPAEQALLAALVDRVVTMIVTFGAGFLYSRILLIRWDKGKSRNQN